MRYLASLLFAVGLVVSVSASAEEAAPEITVSKYGKVFANSDLTLQLVTISGSKGVLARFTGAPAEEEGIDGRVMSYDALNGGNGYDYRGRGKGGVGVNRMWTRPSLGDKTIEVSFQNKTYKLTYDEKASKALDTSKLLSDYKATRNKPGP